MVPGLLALLAVRYLTPPAGETGVLGLLARAGNEYPVVLGAGLFVLFASVAGHWWGVARPVEAVKPRASGLRQTVSLLLAVVVAAGLALLLRGSLFDSYVVEGDSMLPTLEPGDRIGAYRAAYGFALGPFGRERRAMPHRGDVIVLQNPEGNDPRFLVKRVIGLPGDRIQMGGGHPVINDWVVPSCDAGMYLYVTAEGTVQGRLMLEFLGDRAYLTVHSGSPPPFSHTFIVPPGNVFVLGDDRDKSVDSRAWNDGEGGGVDLATIEGRADWFLVGTMRSGRPDFGRAGRLASPRIHMPGISEEAAALGIARCLKSAPPVTDPPVSSQDTSP